MLIDLRLTRLVIVLHSLAQPNRDCFPFGQSRIRHTISSKRFGFLTCVAVRLPSQDLQVSSLRGAKNVRKAVHAKASCQKTARNELNKSYARLMELRRLSLQDGLSRASSCETWPKSTFCHVYIPILMTCQGLFHSSNYQDNNTKYDSSSWEAFVQNSATEGARIYKTQLRSCKKAARLRSYEKAAGNLQESSKKAPIRKKSLPWDMPQGACMASLT